MMPLFRRLLPWRLLLQCLPPRCLLLLICAPALFMCICCLEAVAQGPNQGQPVRVNSFPSQEPAALLYYDASNRLQYRCLASTQAQANTGIFHTWSVAASTLTNVVVLTNVGTITWPAAYGLDVGNQITITGSATTALNATYNIQTTPSSTTATITTSGVSNATYTTGIVLTTTAPPTIDPIWSIQNILYDAASNTYRVQWGFDRNGHGGAGAYNLICANRAVTTGATAISYK